MKKIGTIFLSLGIILLMCSNSLQARHQPTLTVNGSASGATLTQTDALQWTIAGISSGATVSAQLWLDLNGDGVVTTSSDLLFVGFSETDGVSSSDGPGDMDGSANDTIYTSLTGNSFPVGHYVFRVISGTDTIKSAFTITAMTSPTYSISGTVTSSGSGVPNVVIGAETNNGMYFALTDASGNYTIATNLASGTTVKVKFPDGFNSTFSAYTASPTKYTFSLTSSVSGINFVLVSGKIITGTVKDTLDNPIIGYSVYANSTSNVTYSGQTDATGTYSIAVPTGSYIIQYGDQEATTEYVMMYYNQKYLQWNSDTVTVTSSTDTVYNINAVIRKGGIITGTASNVGSNGWNINVYQYGSSFDAAFQKNFDNAGTYSIAVLPGRYTIQFGLNNSDTRFYYNQCAVYPGTAVTVSAIGDTVRNIDGDFSAALSDAGSSTTVVPKKFSLSQNYPNPFNPSTVINFTLPSNSFVTLKIYNLLGKEVATLVNGTKGMGNYSVEWNASQCASGMYFYKLQAGNYTATKKLILLK